MKELEKALKELKGFAAPRRPNCLLYTSDAADDLIGVVLGGRRIIKKKKRTNGLKCSTDM